MNQAELFPAIGVRSAGTNTDWLQGDANALWACEQELLACKQKQAGLSEDLQCAFDECLKKTLDSPLRTWIYNARKTFFQKGKISPAFQEQLNDLSGAHYKHLEKAITDWQEQNKMLEHWRVQFQNEFQQATHHSIDKLRQFSRQENFQRGLLFASHALLKELMRQEKTTKSEPDVKTWLSVYHYACRMAAKTSPLSRFTTVSLWTDQGSEDSEFSFPKIAVTPNVALLPLFYDVLLRFPEFYEQLSVHLSSSLSKIDNYWQWLYFDGENEAFQALPDLDFLGHLYDTFQQKSALSLPDVRKSLSEFVDEEEQDDLLFRLLEMGFIEWILPEKGMSAGWASSLYQFLGLQCQQSERISEAAFLLQSLRTTARALAFLPPDQAMEAQVTARKECVAWLGKYGGQNLDIPIEQLFFEDVSQPVNIQIPRERMENLTQSIATQLRQAAPFPLSPLRQRLQSFANQRMKPGESMDFLSFCRLFLEQKPGAVDGALKLSFPNKIGMLLQVFQEHSSWKVVVNGLYPGGGKMFARWLPLFSEQWAEKIQRWQPAKSIPFPWQDWSNANFQARSQGPFLRVQGNRVGEQDAFLLSDILVLYHENHPLELLHGPTQSSIMFSDLGLESIENAPPVMQILWHLATPQVSTSDFVPTDWPRQLIAPGLWLRERFESENCVWLRKSWLLEQQYINDLAGEKGLCKWTLALRARWREAGLPFRFFAKMTQKRSKPQFFDLNHPVSLLAFQKLWQAHADIQITEMLPEWQDAPARNGEESLVSEFVVEMKITP